MNYIQVEVNNTDKEKNELLVALLSNAGFESFEELDTALKAFIKENEFNQAELDEIINSLNLNYTSSIIPQQNWNAQWESSFEPIIVNDFVGIRAAWLNSFSLINAFKDVSNSSKESKPAFESNATNNSFFSLSVLWTSTCM